MADLQVVPVTPDILWQTMGMEIDLPVKAYVGVMDGELVGSGGLAWGAGRCWLWLFVIDGVQPSAVAVVRWAKRMLRHAVQIGETEVFTPRDDEYPSSEKLLTMLGFRFVEMDGKTGKEIWSCRV